MSELGAEAEKIVERVQKLLTLAANNQNAEEAASATSKAQELLAAYNLDMAAVEEAAGKRSGKREDAKLKGGVYEYQRDLWRAVAHLNFCLYWTQKTGEWGERRKRDEWSGEMVTRKVWLRGYQHRIVGRMVNTAATKAMASYLEQAIERLLRERLGDQPGANKSYVTKMLFSRWAVSFREGAAASVIEKVYERRRELLSEEKRKKMDAEKAAREAGREGVSTSTALSLHTYIDQETDANMDFLYGEGWSAKQALERAERARLQKEADDRYTAWAEANPEEAAKEEAKRQKEERKRSSRRTRSYSSGGKQYDASAYYSGVDAGKKISLDQQTESRKDAGRLTHG